MDGFPSGQRGQTVNLLQIASVVRIHLHPFDLPSKSNFIFAGVAELADAQDLKSCCSNTVPVRFRSPAVIFSRGSVELISISFIFWCKKIWCNLVQAKENLPLRGECIIICFGMKECDTGRGE